MKRERVLGWLAILFAAAAIGFGGLWMQERARLQAYHDVTAAQGVIEGLGPGFEDVRAVVSTHIRANVLGEVNSTQDLERLNRSLDSLEPAQRARVHVIVKVRQGPPATDRTETRQER
jgi:hypothetical protein